MKMLAAVGVLMLGSAMGMAQAKPGEVNTAAEQQALIKTLVEKAKDSKSGSASETIAKYDKHYTMMSVRVKNGGAELHEHWADMFIVLEGEGIMITGGTIPDKKATPGKEGEYTGTSIEGGTKTVLHKGDVFQIPANTPHQGTVEPGKQFIYYVVKIHD